MENQGQNKNPNKHLIISLSIIGAAVIVALIIAVAVIVTDLGKRIDGKNASELYEDLEATVISESNYEYKVEREGNLMFLTNGGEETKAVIKNVEEVKVDGDKLFYMQRIFSDDITTPLTTLTVTIVDGIAYISNQSTGEATKYKAPAEANDYKNSLTVIKSLMWDYDSLFEKINPVQKNGVYLVEMNKDLALDDPKLATALKSNAESFIDSNLPKDEADMWKLFLKSFEEYDYAITYDESGRPVSLAYDYVMGNGNLFVGDISVSASFKYGSAEIEKPQNADSYIQTIK